MDRTSSKRELFPPWERSRYPIGAKDLDNKTKITQTHTRQTIISAYSDKNGLTCETGR